MELELRDDATTGIMLFNAHSFSNDHCCRYITRRLCLARAQPRGPLSHLQLHARPVCWVVWGGLVRRAVPCDHRLGGAGGGPPQVMRPAPPHAAGTHASPSSDTSLTLA